MYKNKLVVFPSRSVPAFLLTEIVMPIFCELIFFFFFCLTLLFSELDKQVLKNGLLLIHIHSDRTLTVSPEALSQSVKQTVSIYLGTQRTNTAG